MIAVGVDGERAVGLDPHLGRARDARPRAASTCVPSKTFGRGLVRKRSLPVSPHRDDVEQAVVELGVRGDEHAAAVGLAVGGGDRVAAELAALAVEGRA